MTTTVAHTPNHGSGALAAPAARHARRLPAEGWASPWSVAELPDAHTMPLYEGVTLCLLTALSLLAFLGLRYPSSCCRSCCLSRLESTVVRCRRPPAGARRRSTCRLFRRGGQLLPRRRHHRRHPMAPRLGQPRADAGRPGGDNGERRGRRRRGPPRGHDAGRGRGPPGRPRRACRAPSPHHRLTSSVDHPAHRLSRPRWTMGASLVMAAQRGSGSGRRALQAARTDGGPGRRCTRQAARCG